MTKEGIEKMFAEEFKFIAQALETIKGKKENGGIIACPKCNGELHYSRAKLNDHVWGKCKTTECLSWMQ